MDADEGETIKVRVSFTDDADNQESLTSAATDTVAPAPEPLTASFSGVPAEHAGEGTFTFGLTFSEDVEGLSFKTLRDEAFDVNGGTVRRAKRKQSGSNLGWTIHVEPASDGPVTIRLPAGSVETADGRALSNSSSATVAGPVGIAVADARVEEAAGAVLEFVVALSRAAGAAFTVAYQTADGSAQAGDDYTAASGTLSFQTGDTSKTIEVAVLDDAHDEGEETLTLTLSNASSGRLTDAEATGTIKNHDPMPRALLARFGRTAAVHVVEHVEERIAAPREPGFRGRFAGRELRRGMERDIALSFLRQLGGAGGVHAPGAGTWPMPVSVCKTRGKSGAGDCRQRRFPRWLPERFSEALVREELPSARELQLHQHPERVALALVAVDDVASVAPPLCSDRPHGRSSSAVPATLSPVAFLFRRLCVPCWPRWAIGVVEPRQPLLRSTSVALDVYHRFAFVHGSAVDRYSRAQGVFG